MDTLHDPPPYQTTVLRRITLQTNLRINTFISRYGKQVLSLQINIGTFQLQLRCDFIRQVYNHL